MITTKNPATGETIAEYETLDENGIDRKLEAATRAFRDWRTTSLDERTKVLSRLGDLYEANQEELAKLAVAEMGKPITQARIREIAEGPGVTILCGRFEGFDERLFEARPFIEEVSLADIVLSGGETAAIAILDACIRLLPGVMGAASSGTEESFEDGLLEYPHYTRPQEWEGRTIPEVLRSGDHAKIAAWRKARSEDDTRLRRPDLWERYCDARDRPASGARRKD